MQNGITLQVLSGMGSVVLANLIFKEALFNKRASSVYLTFEGKDGMIRNIPCYSLCSTMSSHATYGLILSANDA